jgi:acetyltransferase-like isoleucine patch superfamily enzyme
MLGFVKNYFYLLRNLFSDHTIGSDYTKKCFKKKNFFIGDFTYGIPKVIDGSGKNILRIGKFCSFGSDVSLMLAANHRIDWITAYPLGLIKGIESEKDFVFGKGDIIIGNDVWIGNNVIIMSGVNVGSGAVLGAGSIVTKNVEPYEIVAGNPAHHIRFRFSPDKIKALLEMAWWDWDIEKIRQKAKYLQSPF